MITPANYERRRCGAHHNNMDEFYQANTDEDVIENDFLREISSKSNPSIYLKVSSILFVRAGLFLSQVSSIPSSNIQILIFQNILDIALNTVIYSVIGYVFAFGGDVGTFIGAEGFLADDTSRSDFAEGWLIVIAVSGLLMAAVGDRISFISSVVINILVSGLILPVFIHWILSDSGWMRVQTFAKVRVSYKDYSYSCLIHMSGGFLAFISLLILNKRLLRFKDMDVCSIPDNGPSLTLFGNFFMIIGFFGMAVPTEKYLITHLNYNFYGIVMTNMLLSAFGAISSTLLLTFLCPCEPLHKWTSMRSIQAGISGIAAIAGGADLYHPLASLVVGIFNGVVFFFVSLLVNISPIEDYSNIIACHFVSGFLGTLLPPIIGIREGFHTILYYCFMHATWQLLCDLTILSVLVTVFTPVTFLLDYFSILRSWDEDINHRRALYSSKSAKPNRENAIRPQTQEQSINYLEIENKRMDMSEPDRMSEPTEKVDVIFESNTPVNEHGREISGDEFQKYSKSHFDNDKYFTKYVLNSKPLTFFENIDSDSRETLNLKINNCGDTFSKNSNIFDVKLLKGIRNISDSKLVHKFKKDSQSVKKKQVAWNRENEFRLGSVSNIWFPSSVRVSVETQV